MKGNGSTHLGSEKEASADRTLPLSFRRRVHRKLSRIYQSVRNGARKVFVRTYYAIPGLSKHNPRQKIVRFSEVCLLVSDVPPARAAGSGDWYIRIRPPETIARTPSISIDTSQEEQFHAGTVRYQSGNLIQLPEVFLASVRRGKVYGRELLLLAPDDRIFFESALSRPDYLEASGILDRVRPPDWHDLPGPHVLLGNRSTRGYYHWIIDVLPKLSLVEQFEGLASLPLILPQEQQTFHRESLTLLGLHLDRVRLLPTGYWQTDQVVFPEILAPTGNVSPHAVAWLRHRFLKRDLIRNRSGHRRLYLTRRDASQRRVLNESEIVTFLVSEGFEIVCPGELSFAEQIGLFQNAEVVVAPHGAGVTNLVFAQHAVTLIEFFGDNYINGCFWALANVCGHRHAALIGQSQWLDYKISVTDLKTLFKRLRL